jgi:outer membrane receptor for ferrienterochelin and colicins
VAQRTLQHVKFGKSSPWLGKGRHGPRDNAVMLLSPTLRQALAPCLLAACTAAFFTDNPVTARHGRVSRGACRFVARAGGLGAPCRLPAAAAASAPPAGVGQKVEITGGRESDTDLRRQSTAAKIVIGREEIEKFGDATVGEVLRRLPGVTTPGAPGRGGAPRMRGLGSGFTQLLIDGQRLPPGFSLDA